MAQSIGNSVNPNGSGGMLGGLVNLGQGLYNMGKGFLQSPLFTGNTTFNAGTQPLSQAGNLMSAAGISNPSAQSGSSAVANNKNTYSLNGNTYNAAGGLVSPASAASTGTATPSVYQQNLSRYGLSSIPAGYSFNAQGKLTNGAGQEYVSPSSGNANPQNQQTTPAQNTGAAPAQIGYKQAYAGQAAPQGYMWGPDGSLMIQSGMMTNAQGTPTPTATNIITGGGTQTNFPSVVGGEAAMAAQSSPEYQAAVKQYMQAMGGLADLQNQLKQEYNQDYGSGYNLSQAQGKYGLAQNLATGAAQQLSTEAQASSNVMGAATGQQQVQQQGLLGAGGLLSPQLAGPTNVPFYPGQSSPSAGGYGQPAAGAYGGDTGSGLFNVGGLSGTMALGQQYTQTLLPAYNAAGAILNDPTNGMDAFLAQHPEINPSKLMIGNQLQQWVQGQMSDPDLNTFQQKLNEFLSTATPLVGAMGGMTNFKQSMVNDMLNSLSQGKSVSAAMHTMYDLMGAKLKAIAQTGSGEIGNTNENSNGTPNTTFTNINQW